MQGANNYQSNRPTWADILPPAYTQKQDEEIELMQTYPALLTVTTTAKEKAKKLKKEGLYTNIGGGQGMTEGLLAEDQPDNDDFFNDRGRLGEQLDAIAPQNQKEEDSSEEYAEKGDVEEEDDEERKKDNKGAEGAQGAVAVGGANPNLHEKKGAGHQPPKKPDPIYLVYASIACLCFASSGVIRKFQGKNVLLSNAIMALAFLFAAILHFLYSAIKKRAKREKYMFPW